jgi:putative CocE/NonD family hydrolase
MDELSSCATPQLPDNYSFQTTNIVAQDGTPLGTDLYLPKKKGKFPTVLARTPYDKNFVAILPIVKPFLDQGFAVVVQDCRGRLTSKGEFFPFVDERKDGLDTVKWIKKQKWSNGKIAGFAGSYNGYTQIAIADVLDVATLHVTGGNTYKIIYPYGIFSPKTVFSWGFSMDTPQKEYDINKAYKILPLSSAAIKSYGKTNKFIAEYLKHENYDDFWKKQNNSKYIKCPALFMAGWYDMFIGPQFDDFLALDKKTGGKCRIVVGPWCHGNQVLEKEYGGEEKTGNRELLNYQYLIAALKGQNTDKLFTSPYKNKKYNLFIMERNEYVGSDVWPPKETSPTKFYLHSGKQLSTKIQKKNEALKYTYDPADPFPSLGGSIFGEDVGPADQSSTTSRTDQLIFDMEIKNKPVTLLGPINAELFVETDAKCTDFFVSVQDVFPKKGPIVNIQNGGTKFIPKSKNKPDKLKIEIWPTGYQINPGHKLRIVITSSCFPAFNRNLNTGEPIYSAKKMVKANQKIFVGKEFPSSVSLPVYNK